jgi:hypothetical protein
LVHASVEGAAATATVSPGDGKRGTTTAAIAATAASAIKGAAAEAAEEVPSSKPWKNPSASSAATDKNQQL